MKKTACIILAAALGIISANGATTLVSSDFETGLGAWTTSTGASLYTFSSGHNYASGGNGAANLPKSGGTITLTDGLPLATQDYTSITISFDYQRQNATTTRFLVVEYAADGTNFTELARRATGTNQTVFSASITLTEDADHSVTGDMNLSNAAFLPAFTDTAKFRFRDISSAGADVRSYVDNITITGTPDFIIPEPSAALLGGLGALLLLRRRR